MITKMNKIRHFWMKYWLIIAWIAMFFAMMLLGGCKSTKTEYIEKNDSVYIDKIVYRDSSIFVAIPYEVVKEICPQLDTLEMETSVALSRCWVDTCTHMLKGTLTNKKNGIKTDVKIPTRYIVKTNTKYINKIVTVQKNISFLYKVQMILSTIFGCMVGIYVLWVIKKWKD